MQHNKIVADLHRELDHLVESGNQLFISNWNGQHPYAEKYLGDIQLNCKSLAEYSYVRANKELYSKIIGFHKLKDGVTYSESQLLPANGSTTIITAFFTWLLKNGIKEVFYVPPVYFTFSFFAKAFGIRLRPVSSKQLFEPDSTINLPEENSVLLLTDPIWYTGCPVKQSILNQIARWQKETQSIIFIDGSFQYMKWDQSQKEGSTIFDPEYSFRIICPTKALSLHGFRFSYLLLPERYEEDFDFILDNISGSSSQLDVVLAIRAMDVLLSEESNTLLIDHIKSRYNDLLSHKLIAGKIQPECGYFIFDKVLIDTSDLVKMEGRFFDLDNYPDFYRINLLVPDLLSELVKRRSIL